MNKKSGVQSPPTPKTNWCLGMIKINRSERHKLKLSKKKKKEKKKAIKCKISPNPTKFRNVNLILAHIYLKYYAIIIPVNSMTIN